MALLQLLVNIRGLEEHHVDEGDEKIRSTVFAPLSSIVSSVQNPLNEDHGDQVSEEEQKENNLGKKLQENLVIMPFGDLVPKTESDTKGHMDDPENEGNLHLVGVQETNLVCSGLPNRIYTERIGVPDILFWLLRIKHPYISKLNRFVSAS